MPVNPGEDGNITPFVKLWQRGQTAGLHASASLAGVQITAIILCDLKQVHFGTGVGPAFSLERVAMIELLKASRKEDDDDDSQVGQFRDTRD
jgi:hypothetical protein